MTYEAQHTFSFDLCVLLSFPWNMASASPHIYTQVKRVMDYCFKGPKHPDQV